MEKFICDKEKEIKDLEKRIRDIEIMDAERNKDIEFIKSSFEKLNKTLDDLIKTIDSINKRPLEKYEKVAWMVISGLIAFILGTILK